MRLLQKPTILNTSVALLAHSRMFIDSKVLQPALIGIAVLISVFQVNAACTPPAPMQAKLRAHPTAAVYSEVGAWYTDHKQFDCAADAYAGAVRKQPGSARLQYLLGFNLYSAGRGQEALQPLQRSIRIDANVLNPHLVLAETFAALKRGDEAQAEWQSALKIDPHSTAALEGLSQELLNEKKNRDVVELLSSGANSEKLTLNLAQAYAQMRMLEDAAKALNGGLTSYPFSVAIANALARVEIQQFHYQEAETIVAKTAKEHPSDQDTMRLYLQAMVLAGNTTVARPLAQKMLAQSPHDFELLYLNGVMEYDAGEFEAARKHLEEAVVLSPDTAAARFNLGQVQAQLGDTNGAKQQLEEALKLGATEPEVHLQLGKVLHTLGENDRAAQELKLYQEGLKRNHDRALAASKAAQGDKELDSGDPKKAAAFYREALDAVPDDAQLNFKLGVALDKAGDVPAERAALEKAVELNPDLATAQNQLGFLASQSGDNTGAEKHFREAVRAAPGFTEAWVNLAATLGLEQRFAEARQAVTSALQLEPQNPKALLIRDSIEKAQAQR